MSKGINCKEFFSQEGFDLPETPFEAYHAVEAADTDFGGLQIGTSVFTIGKKANIIETKDNKVVNYNVDAEEVRNKIYLDDMNSSQKKLFNKILSSEDELITVDGPDAQVVNKLLDKRVYWADCLDEAEYGVHVYNSGTEDNPEIYVATYSSYDPSIDLKELAECIKNGRVLTEEKDIKNWIIDSEYMDVDEFDEEDLKDL